jgi:tRNA(Arg) A34 adenosine deaminase TadA|tara:strand:+ start:851 stop:1330 length:480 start_codon:yes stop_codon:yes gene_type:complete
MSEEHVAYMQAALEEANKAATADEVPIGAVLVNKTSGEIVARGFNTTRMDCDPTAHAEINAIRALAKKVGAQRIPDHDLYVTLEPCPMCASAISFARISRVIYGADDAKSGGLSVLDGPNLYSKSALHHKPEVISGHFADECGAVIRDFFKAKRKQKNT